MQNERRQEDGTLEDFFDCSTSNTYSGSNFKVLAEYSECIYFSRCSIYIYYIDSFIITNRYSVKMLNKCKKSVSEVSLTELIDEQGISVKEKIVEKYGSECESRNLPIIAALKASLTVDGKKEWLPAYKKSWKINPDSLKLSLIKWSMLIYQECLVSSY